MKPFQREVIGDASHLLSICFPLRYCAMFSTSGFICFSYFARLLSLAFFFRMIHALANISSRTKPLLSTTISSLWIPSINWTKWNSIRSVIILDFLAHQTFSLFISVFQVLLTEKRFTKRLTKRWKALPKAFHCKLEGANCLQARIEWNSMNCELPIACSRLNAKSVHWMVF